MEVELKHRYSTSRPDEAAIVAARGDYMEGSIVGEDVYNVLDGIDVEKAENEDMPEKKRGFIEKLMRRGHLGPFEHSQAFFAVEGISRACMAQLTRHRHASFDVQSMRYVNFDDADVVMPPSLEDCRHPAAAKNTYKSHVKQSFERYQELVHANGVPEEDARMVLPIGTKVNLTFSINPRSLMHVADMRNAGDSQWEIRELTKKLLEEAHDWAPITFEMYEKHMKGESKKAP